MDVSEPWFSHIRSGAKTVEGRKKSPTWENIRVGDVIVIKCNTESFNVVVTNIVEYHGEDPLTAYLLGEGISNCLPGIVSLSDARAVYLQWSTEAEIKAMGMLGIHIQRIPDKE